MNILKDDLKFVVQNAINKFNDKEKYLIFTNLSERCICAKFAMYLSNEINESKFREYEVDVEYNRGAYGNDLDAKILEDKRIIVDLIVHKRGYDPVWGYDNLICIEMKKSKDRRGFEEDEIRLSKLTNSSYGYFYKLGVMVIIDMADCLLKIKEIF